MKFAIFDGILETHVASSLERALVKRGHKVLNTSKIGAGFKFPEVNADLGRIENYIQEIVALRPDVVFVMRPCSLPPKLLRKLKRTGATMIAWFSDDPVLFELSYGPVVDLYDLVLHCGNSTVLKFYEDFFGRPTGINFPFWTDHDAFPYVWGAEKPTTDFMFLGNVQDEVRRSRYFELARIPQSVRVHGNVGSDYFGLSGGYLDSDAEVAMSGSTTKMALNIPQFFRNHRHLETWFDGLEKLGFFEYPSRVVQYMAMGIPTISVIPGSPKFRSYPEMIVARDIFEASKSFERAEPQLEELSLKTLSRFDKNFSADSRVMALENLLHDESWKKLDAVEREVWFTQFNGNEVKSATDQKENDNVSGTLKVKPIDKEVGGNRLPQVIVLGDFRSFGGWTRAKAIADAFDGYANVLREDVAASEDVLVPDPSNICSKAVNVNRIRGVQKLRDSRSSNARKILVVVGRNIAITSSARKYLMEEQILPILVDDSEDLTYKQKSRQLEGYSFVAYGIKEIADDLKNRGFSSVGYWPLYPDKEFLQEVSNFSTDDVASVIRVREKRQVEEVVAPCYTKDLPNVAVEKTIDIVDLKSMTREEVIEALSSTVCLASYGGTRQRPRLNQILANAVGASDLAYFARCPEIGRIYPFNLMSILVANVGELFAKTASLFGYPQAADNYEGLRKTELEKLWNKSTKLAKTLCFGSVENSDDQRVLTKGVVKKIPFSSIANDRNPNMVAISISINSLIGDCNHWSVAIKVNGERKYHSIIRDGMEVVLPSVRSGSLIEIEAEYRGGRVVVSAREALNAQAEVRWTRALVAGSARRVGVLVRK